LKRRITIVEGDVSAQEVEAVVNAAGSDEGSVRTAIRAALERAAERGVRTIAVDATAAGGSFPLQRRAEVLIEEARRHLDGATSLEEVRFVLQGEPVYRVFEMVNDAAKVAEQMARLAQRSPRT
jgi:O-acetyl-ADP-ribose deacetylase (regulator of RNase III)